MLKRFPHTITYQTEGTASGWDEDNGVPIPAIPGEDITLPCRAEPNIRQNYVIREDDGQRVEFSWLIHMEVSTDRIPYGKKVTVNGDGQVLEGTVIRSHRNQLHNQSWI